MDENQTPCAEPEGSFNNPIIIHIPEWMPIRMWGTFRNSRSPIFPAPRTSTRSLCRSRTGWGRRIRRSFATKTGAGTTGCRVLQEHLEAAADRRRPHFFRWKS